MKKISKFLLLISAISFFSCYEEPKRVPAEIIGTWVAESGQTIFHFENEIFTFFKEEDSSHLAYFLCCDTLATGHWEITEKNMLLLNTDDRYNKKSLDIIVKESHIDTDSLFIEIINPFELENPNNEVHKEIAYRITTYAFDDIDLVDDISLKFHFETKLAFENENRSGLDFIQIEMLPTQNLNLSSLGIRSANTRAYMVKSKNSNFFEIRIPEFDLDYLGRRRFIDHYIEIINDSTITFENELYIKK